MTLVVVSCSLAGSGVLLYCYTPGMNLSFCTVSYPSASEFDMRRRRTHVENYSPSPVYSS